MRVGDYGEMWLIVGKYGYKIKTGYGHIQTETFVTHMKRLNTVKPHNIRDLTVRIDTAIYG